MASWPKETAAIRAVVPSSFWVLASAPLERRVCTVSCWLAFIAAMKGSLELVISQRRRLIRCGFFEFLDTLKACRSSESFGGLGERGTFTGIGRFMPSLSAGLVSFRTGMGKFSTGSACFCVSVQSCMSNITGIGKFSSRTVSFSG